MQKEYHKFFIKNGYCKLNLFSKNEIKNLLEEVSKRVKYLCPNIYKLNKKIDLKNFHKLNLPENFRNKILDPSARYFKFNKKTFLTNSLKNKIYLIMREFWGHNKYCIYWIGSAKKKQIKANAIGFRLVRPSKKSDGGSEHIDAYSKDVKAFFTLWVPLTGFSKKYTLKVAPRSHTKLHSLSNYQKQKKYISRTFKTNYVKKFKFTRPNLKIGDAIIHHPNIIHGGNINYGKNTRISIEIRIFDQLKFNRKKYFEASLVN